MLPTTNGCHPHNGIKGQMMPLVLSQYHHLTMHKIAIVVATFVAVGLAQRYAEPNYPPIPYSFNYDTRDVEGTVTRSESGDGSGRVTGEYTMQLSDGRTRTVRYTADEHGYRAEITTNELGTESKNPADVTIHSSAPTGPEAALAAEPARLSAHRG